MRTAGVSYDMDRLQIGKKSFLLVFALLVVANVFAQLALKLDVSSRSIGKDEVLQVSYTVQNASELSGNLSVSSFPGWKIVSGPQTSQETSIINGVRSSSIGYIYLLMPQRTGNLSIPGASISADGKQLTCAGTTIKVSNQSTGGGAPTSNSNSGGMSGLQSLLDQLSSGGDQPETGNVLHRGENVEQKIKDNMFVRATPSKKTVYVGEPFSVTYQLFSALGGQSKVTAQPSFKGVSVLDLTKEESQPETVTIGNKRYRSFLIRRVQLTALQPGPISLGTIETSNDIPFSSYDDPYNTKTYTQLLQNAAVTVEAKALPEAGKPSDFSGAIGKFQIHVVPQRINSPARENNILHVEITGTGNLLPATIPNINWPAGVEHYDPKDSQNVDKRNFPVLVSKVFEVPFIGDKQGKVTFSPISFSYFDTESNTYKTIQSDPFTVEFTAPLSKKPNNDNSFGTSIINVAKILGGIILAVLVILLIVKATKKSKTPSPSNSKKSVNNKNQDETAPWNIEEKKQSPEPIEPKKEEIVEQPKVEEVSKKNFNIELQKIMLATDKSEMYALGSSTLQDILAEYLHAPNLSKNQLIDELKQSSNPNAANVLASVNVLQDQINKGLYSPLFSEADKLSLIDGLNDLLRNAGF